MNQNAWWNSEKYNNIFGVLQSSNIKFYENPVQKTTVLFHADGQTDMMTQLVVAFRNIVNAPKNRASNNLSQQKKCGLFIITNSFSHRTPDEVHNSQRTSSYSIEKTWGFVMKKTWLLLLRKIIPAYCEIRKYTLWAKANLLS